MAEYDSDLHLHFHHGRVERVKLKRTYPTFLDGEQFAERNNTGGPRHVPGIHVAINFERHPNIQFSHGFGLWKQNRLSSSEITMIRLMNDLTEQEDWHVDVFNFSAVKLWKAKALSGYFDNHELWEWCLFELMDKAKRYKSSQFTLALDSASRVCKSDRMKDSKLFAQFIQNTGKRSISPWLYPFIYAGTPVRADGEAINLENIMSSIGGGIIPPRPYWDNDKWSGEVQYYSKTSQWIAADMEFTGKGNSLRFLSPINNLHPLRHKPLYAAIETLATDSIPEWNEILLYKSLQRNGPRIKTKNNKCTVCNAGPQGDCSCGTELNDFSKWVKGNIGPGTQQPPEDLDWDATSALNGEYTDVERIYDSISLSQAFKDKGLQVYIELESLDVDVGGYVEAQSFRRFEWGLNGNRNERIVATSLLCLRRQNIHPQYGTISFRSEVTANNWKTGAQKRQAQASNSAPVAVSGDSTAPQFQELVTIALPEGRVITFPNVLQHKFHLKLDDQSKPGKLQFLAIHLVDPHYLVSSTKHIPPQSVSWWWEAARLGYVCRRHKIPLEIKRLFVDFAIGEGCGHSLRQEATTEDPDGDSNGGSNSRMRFAQDNSPEQVQEEKPVRIEAATRMRTVALEEHSGIIRTLNHSRIYGVPIRLRPWYRRHSTTVIPLDHSEPKDAACNPVNSAINKDGRLVWAPEEGEEGDDEDDDDNDDGGQQTGVITTGNLQNNPSNSQPAQAGAVQTQAAQTQAAQTQAAQTQTTHTQAANTQAANTQAAQPHHNNLQGNLPANSQMSVFPSHSTRPRTHQAHGSSTSNCNERMRNDVTEPGIEASQEQVSAQIYADYLHARENDLQGNASVGNRSAPAQPEAQSGPSESRRSRIQNSRILKRQYVDEEGESSAQGRRRG